MFFEVGWPTEPITPETPKTKVALFLWTILLIHVILKNI